MTEPTIQGVAVLGEAVQLDASPDGGWWTLAYEGELKARDARITRLHLDQIIANFKRYSRAVPVPLYHADLDSAAHPESRKAHAWLDDLRLGSMEVRGKTVATLQGLRRWVNDATRADMEKGALVCGSVTVFFDAEDVVTAEKIGAYLYSFSLTNNPALTHLPALAASQSVPASNTPQENIMSMIALAARFGVTATDEAVALAAVESRVAESNDVRGALHLSASAPSKDVAAAIAKLSADAARVPALTTELAAFRKAADDAQAADNAAYLDDVMLAEGHADSVKASLSLHLKHDREGFTAAHPRPSREELAQRSQDSQRLARPLAASTGKAPAPTSGTADEPGADDIDAAVTDLMASRDCSYAEALDLLAANG